MAKQLTISHLGKYNTNGAILLYSLIQGNQLIGSKVSVTEAQSELFRTARGEFSFSWRKFMVLIGATPSIRQKARMT